MEQLVVSRVEGSLCEITLNRPEKKNALTFQMWQQLDSCLIDVSRQDGLRCLVIKGMGSAFSVGADVHAFLNMDLVYGKEWQEKGRIIAYDMQSVLNRLQRLEIPSIAIIQGFCLGLGFELALACDFRLASASAQFGLPETLLGLIPDVGGTARLSKLVGASKAKEIILTGKQFTSDVALSIGVVNAVVDEEAELASLQSKWVSSLEKPSKAAVAMAKRIIDGSDNQNHMMDLEGWAQTQLYQTEYFQEKLKKFAEKHSN